MFVYIHFKSFDQFLDKTPFDFSNIFCAMESCAMSTKSYIILSFPGIWSHDLKWVKQTVADEVYGLLVFVVLFV